MCFPDTLGLQGAQVSGQAARQKAFLPPIPMSTVSAASPHLGVPTLSAAVVAATLDLQGAQVPGQVALWRVYHRFKFAMLATVCVPVEWGQQGAQVSGQAAWLDAFLPSMPTVSVATSSFGVLTFSAAVAAATFSLQGAQVPGQVALPQVNCCLRSAMLANVCVPDKLGLQGAQVSSRAVRCEAFLTSMPTVSAATSCLGICTLSAVAAAATSNLQGAQVPGQVALRQELSTCSPLEHPTGPAFCCLRGKPASACASALLSRQGAQVSGQATLRQALFRHILVWSVVTDRMHSSGAAVLIAAGVLFTVGQHVALFLGQVAIRPLSLLLCGRRWFGIVAAFFCVPLMGHASRPRRSQTAANRLHKLRCAQAVDVFRFAGVQHASQSGSPAALCSIPTVFHAGRSSIPT